LADAHTDGTKEEEVATTHLLNHPKTGESGDDVDQVSDETDEEGVLDTSVLEELSSVIKDEVDTSKLLEGLKSASGQ